MSENKKIRFAFAPGVLEQLEADNTPEELQELLDELAAKVSDGSIFEDSNPVNLEELEQTDPELFTHLMSQMQKIQDNDDLTFPTLH